MMHFELLRDRGILLVTPDGPLEKTDFARLAKEVAPFIASNGRLAGLMIRTKSFPGWESLSALVSHFRFVADHHRKIARIAVVTDGELLKILPRIAAHFVKAEIRQFGFDQKDDALAWLEL
jgi:stage II sporulation SpoAA-like protein